jgi:hypothetical protein
VFETKTYKVHAGRISDGGGMEMGWRADLSGTPRGHNTLVIRRTGTSAI